MKRSISSILGQMNQVLNPSPDDSDTEAIMIIEDSETVTLTKLQVWSCFIHIRNNLLITVFNFLRKLYMLYKKMTIHF